MNLKKSNKIISSIVLVFMLLSQFGGVFATQIGEVENLISLGTCRKRY